MLPDLWYEFGLFYSGSVWFDVHLVFIQAVGVHIYCLV